MAAVPQQDPASEAARSLYEAYRAPVYRYCLSRLRNPEEAEDAVQQAFMQAFRAFQRGFRPDVEAAWIFKIAHNVCLTRALSVKRRKRIETATDLGELQDELPSAFSGTPDELFSLRDALGEMPARLRSVLLLREWRGLSYKEIAEEMDVSVSAVETLVFRARRHLAQALTEPARRAKRAFDGLGIAQLLKALLAGGTAAKTAATVAVATVGAAALATAGGSEAPRPHSAVVRTAAVRPAVAPQTRAVDIAWAERIDVARARPPARSGATARSRPVTDAPAAPGAAATPPSGGVSAAVPPATSVPPVSGATPALPAVPSLPVAPPALPKPPVSAPEPPAVPLPQPPPVEPPPLPALPPVEVPPLPPPPEAPKLP